jgi:gamma-butyrobetaine dioxygenase
VDPRRLVRDLPAVWLRANCPCGQCVDFRSGQRLVSITELPADPTVTEITEMTQITEIAGVAGHLGSVRVTFAPDGHQAEFAASWLAGLTEQAPDPRTEDAKRLWTASTFGSGLPGTTWPSYAADPGQRAGCLESLLADGFFVLHEVPAEPGMVLTVAQSLAFVRETNYGQLFDVRVVADPANLAYSALAIGPHTDNPYRDPVPTVQLLHCLVNAAEGGDSSLVDGFMAARLLRAADPEAFGVLAGTPVTFRYTDATADLTATKPMIGVDPDGRIRQVRFNNRSLQPLALARDAAAFYAAYRSFAEILLRPSLTATFRLDPGDCVVFDNTRILHARTAFTAAGQRHLQGCYADLDGVASQLAILRRGATAGPGSQREGD